jgi:hypothetical protein
MYCRSPLEIMTQAIRLAELPNFGELNQSLSSYQGYGGQMRFLYAEIFGYGVPCREVIDEVAKYSPLLELGAGNGFWTFWLRKKGCDIIATDAGEPDLYTKNRWIDDLLPLDAVTAVNSFPDRNILIVWPHFTAYWPVEIIGKMKRSQILCYVGEGPLGCCAPPSFFLEMNRCGLKMIYASPSPSWPKVSDYLAIYMKM